VLGLAPITYFVVDWRRTHHNPFLVLLRTLAACVIAFIPIAGAVSSLITAPQRSRQNKTLQRMRTIAQSNESDSPGNLKAPSGFEPGV